MNRMNAPNLALRALVAALALPLSALIVVPQKAHAAEFQAFTGSVGKKGRSDTIALNLSDPSTVRATLKWSKPKAKARLALYLKPAGGDAVVALTGKRKPKSFQYDAGPGNWWIFVRALKGGSTYSLQLSVEPEAPGPAPEPCDGVSVDPSTVQDAMDAHPAGTTFCFAAGTYSLSEPLVPETGDALVSEGGAVLDGGGKGTAAIWGTSAVEDVTVRGLEIRSFANNGDAYAGDAAIKAGRGWTIAGNDVHHNGRIGIRVGDANSLLDNSIHHNGQYGVFGAFLTSSLWEGNEIAYNNTKNFSFGDAGATKVIKSSQVTFRDNHVHHNNGNGLWADTDNLNFVYEDNLVEYNVGSGILHEISYDAIIRNNVVRYNAAIADGQSIGHGSNIQVSVSQNVGIYGNLVVGDTNGIGLHDTDRGTGAWGEYKVANVNVHHNVVKMEGAATTGLHGYRASAYAPEANNRFVSNTYYVKSLSGSYWMWETNRKWTGWRQVGHDSDGSLKTW